jgi:cellulose synthase/poly-beta-1,6-N-acetylglucosamine synthase-like glycosyltransferase
MIVLGWIVRLRRQLGGLLRRRHDAGAGRRSIVRVVDLTRVDKERILTASIERLKNESPELSAHRTLAIHQRRGLIAIGLAASTLLAVPYTRRAFVVLVIAVVTVLYVAVLAHRVLLFRRGLAGATIERVPDDEARALSDESLPVYTILVPAYDEPKVIARLLDAIAAIEYPRDKLDVKLLLEEDDHATWQAVLDGRPPGEHVEVVPIPPSEPRTKPKACNYGLALARGEFVTIYDAEDRPDPLQLRRAVAVFRRSPDVGCLQAKLGYFNDSQNRITQWFTAEYDGWFAHVLPGLVATGAPLPLGGTSNHIRRSLLEDIGGWDPYNVTEDCDLGIRLYRTGSKIRVLDSTTFEEANSDFVNWIRQRSRWYKGYLQTWLVHMRRPVQLWRELTPRGFLGFNLFVGGTPLLALLNPLFWAMTVLWFALEPRVIQQIFPAVVYYPALASFLLGNATVVYLNVLSIRANDRPELLGAVLLTPAYWLMMSIAAVKATVQVVRNPSFWEKTAHGLDIEPAVVGLVTVTATATARARQGIGATDGA